MGASGLTTLPDRLPPHITTLVIARNSLISLPELPPGLLELNVSHNQLASLPELPSGLLELDVSHNQLTNLSELPSGLLKLDVFDNQLTSLPALPAGLQILYAADNQLTGLPELSSGLQELDVSENLLTSLPALPAGLQILYATDNPQLTSLPALSPGLQTLWVYNNRLASLPTLPSELRELWVYNNQLTSLPALPLELQMLWAYNNRLASLPTLPLALRELDVSRNQLTRLAELPAGLRLLDVSRNQLTRLPQSLTGLSSAATVNLRGNPLSVRTLQDLRDIINARGHSDSRINFDMAGSSVPREARALHLAVADWLTFTQEGEAAPADRWQAFGQEDNATAFSLVLDRLCETENFEKNAGFKAQIASWLTQLAEDAALREKTFAMATEATSSCEDRVTHALHQMNNVQLVHNAEKGVYDNNLLGLVSTGREMFRLAKLEQIAREKVRTLVLVDEIEIYMAYQNKLKESLELSSVTAEMRFFSISGVTVSDLQAAELQVKTAENSEFREWILQWGPLHSVLERKVPERFNALREKQISDYDEAYRKLHDEELKSSGLVDDTDAERTIGVSAMESAKKAFLDGLRSLVDEVLGSYLTARWRLN